MAAIPRRGVRIAAVVLLVLATVLLSLLPAGAAGTVPRFGNATYTGAPSCDDILLPDRNPDVPLHLCAIVRRPEGGGGLRIVTLFTSDGVLADIDMAARGYQDCFGADPWPSRFSATVKAVVNCKVPDAGNGNDREFPIIDTGIRGSPVTIR